MSFNTDVNYYKRLAKDSETGFTAMGLVSPATTTYARFRILSSGVIPSTQNFNTTPQLFWNEGEAIVNDDFRISGSTGFSVCDSMRFMGRPGVPNQPSSAFRSYYFQELRLTGGPSYDPQSPYTASLELSIQAFSPPDSTNIFVSEFGNLEGFSFYLQQHNLAGQPSPTPLPPPTISNRQLTSNAKINDTFPGYAECTTLFGANIQQVQLLDYVIQGDLSLDTYGY